MMNSYSGRIRIIHAVHGGICAGALLLFGTNAPAGQSKTLHSHCTSNELTAFTCQLVRNNKVVSICSSPAVSAPGGYIQYRFGKLKALEMKFPVPAEQWENAFTASHYFRSHVDRRELSFANSGFRYTVFSSYEGEQRPVEIYAGIVVGKDSDAEAKVLYCRKPFVDNLEVLDAVIVPDVGP